MAVTELNTEATTLQRIKSGKLIEGLEHMSSTYLEGIKRILTVSADTVYDLFQRGVLPGRKVGRSAPAAASGRFITSAY